MALAAQANLYCSEQDVQNLLSSVGELARLDDDGSGTVTAGSAGWVQAANYATARVLAYCQRRYDDIDLATAYLPNYWATVVAAHWLCVRRGNPAPESIASLMFGDGSPDNRGVMGDLHDVKDDKLDVPQIGTRNADKPKWSNVRIDGRYRTKQIRVERNNSETTPGQYPQSVDVTGANNGEI